MNIISCSPYNADTVSYDVISCIRIDIGKVLYHFGQCKQSAMLFESSREILVLLLNDNNYDDDGSYLNAILHGVIAYGDNNAKEEEASAGEKPVAFKYGQRPFQNIICEGVEEGIKGMRVGGKRVLDVPANLAPPGVDLPPGVPLTYEIELTEVLSGYF